MDSPRLYLVCGLPGAGKTTRCRQIADAVPSVVFCADEWVLGLGASLVDFGFRVKLQDCLLAHARTLLRLGVDVVIEFGSWSQSEREAIRTAGEDEGALVELHFVDAPLEELARRVRARGGAEAEPLVQVLERDHGQFERPTPHEQAMFDRFVAPGDVWTPSRP